jgi:hypothetical protein
VEPPLHESDADTRYVGSRLDLSAARAVHFSTRMWHLPRADRALGWICAALGCLAVGADAHAEPGLDVGFSTAPVSGSRLVPVFLTAEDESRQFVGWFDRVRGENCAFSLSADGVIRCLPSDAVEARLFVDATCKQRVVAVTACTLPKYVIEPEPVTAGPTCGSEVRHRIREPGARVRPPSVFSEATGTCSRVPLDATAVYVMVGREVPAASFVAAKYAVGRPGLGLKTEYDAP